MPEPARFTSQMIVEAVGRAIGNQRREIDGQINALRDATDILVTRLLRCAEQGLDVLSDECLEFGETAAEFCRVRFEEPLTEAYGEYFFARSLSADTMLTRSDGKPLMRGKGAWKNTSASCSYALWSEFAGVQFHVASMMIARLRTRHSCGLRPNGCKPCHQACRAILMATFVPFTCSIWSRTRRLLGPPIPPLGRSKTSWQGYVTPCPAHLMPGALLSISLATCRTIWR